MSKIVVPFTPNGIIVPPSSKSYCHRYLIAAFISGDSVSIHNFNFCDDTETTIKCLEKLGAVYEKEGNSIKQVSLELPHDPMIFEVGASASTFRMLFPIISYLSESCKFTSKDGLFKRPIETYLELLEEERIAYRCTDHELLVGGMLPCKDFAIDPSVSSQFISGILFLYALNRTNNSLILTKDPVSWDYAEMTIDVLKEFGYEYDENLRIIEKKCLNLTEITAEADYSAISNYAVFAALKGSIAFIGANKNSKQADRKIIDILEECGAEISWKSNYLTISNAPLKSFNVDLKNCIDLGPILFVLAALIEGDSTITGYENLKFKESDRLYGMLNQLEQVGVEFEMEHGKITVHGKKSYSGKYRFSSMNDHRIAMALSIFAAAGGITAIIDKPECVKKSYPTFFETLEKLKKD